MINQNAHNFSDKKRVKIDELAIKNLVQASNQAVPKSLVKHDIQTLGRQGKALMTAKLVVDQKVAVLSPSQIRFKS